MTQPAGSTESGPPFDAELRASLAVVGGTFPPTVTPDLIGFMRQSYASRPLADTMRGRAVAHREATIEGFRGDPVTLSIFTPLGMTSRRPAIVYAHSGGLMFGDRFNALDASLDWVEKLGAVLISTEYRLAPEFADPYAREDMYATLDWAARNAERVGIDRRRLLVAGASSGGGLAAGLALAARDRDGPAIRGQLLSYPMLDDRGIAPSTQQFDGVGVWDRVSNETGWQAYLQDAYRTDAVSPYAVPARAEDLRGLPPAFLDVGDCEIFRDEVVAYANSLWAAGVNAELHVWPGAFHACDIFAPHTAMAKAMLHTRFSWVQRMLAD
ncbi:alpha/beta hydrolase fold domain-containing protein [Gordonia sp. ABSL49_1]|uniref:alpha/beta hydrolase fold domain-containing protein n=1 Tax=Gordonia sp. ABSL49_1 TaxID=2920941 RepID=UPI001F0EA9C7|nr:alpha/beta hydrolase fold domain-containing protein [Gordonia sp. ABSL49_1]MCH5643278.1 alpha/beta hydrolase [Gordonia sp. ABSL49_1]